MRRALRQRDRAGGRAAGRVDVRGDGARRRCSVGHARVLDLAGAPTQHLTSIVLSCVVMASILMLAEVHLLLLSEKLKAAHTFHVSQLCDCAIMSMAVDGLFVKEDVTGTFQQCRSCCKQCGHRSMRPV